MWTANPHTFRNEDAIAHPLTSCLRPLNPATSHNNNNNNNGGLHACVRATEDIEPFLQLTHLVVECSGFLALAIFIFFLLCFVFPFTVCLFTAHKLYAHALSLLLRFLRISSATYRPGIWTTAFSVVLSGSVWTQIILKQYQGGWRKKKECFRTCGRALTMTVVEVRSGFNRAYRIQPKRPEAFCSHIKSSSPLRTKCPWLPRW